MTTRLRRLGFGARSILVAPAVFGLLLGTAFASTSPARADTAPAAGTPATVSADPLPTMQVNGVVWAQVTVGNTVYATGEFTETWPAGQSDQTGTNGQPGPNETPRSNLLAYDITTGDLIPGFNHTLNAQGLGIAASPDGSTVYVVGDFTTVDGATHNHIAAFDTAHGTLNTAFRAGVSGKAAAVAATSSAIYVGGNFTSSGGQTRSRLAAFTPAGALLSWAPTDVDYQVAALVVSPDGSRVIVGGKFTTLDGQPANGMGSLDATTGEIEPWAINTVIRDGDAKGKCGITNLSVDGTNVYGGGFAYGCGNFEGTFAADPTTGNPVWINDCHGDTYGTAPIGQVLYVASHAHDCSAIGSFPNGTPSGYNQRATAFTTAATGGTNIGPDSYHWDYSGQPDSSLLAWFPTLSPGSYTQQDQAAWSVTGNSSYVAFGGEFPSVNGTAQQGLVRFAVTSAAPNKIGPDATTASSTLVPTVSSTSYGQVDLTWTATWDRDNANLTYRILRDGSVVATVVQASSFWQLPSLAYTDKGLTPGTQHTYRISVSDPSGNKIGSVTSQPVTVSDAGGPPPDSAPSAVFTSSCLQLTCTVDGTGSTDSDGTLTSYAWDFGDGNTGSGATTSHTYADGGPHTITLTVTDNGGVTNAVSHDVTTYAPPTAAFTSSCTLRTCHFDAGGSTDANGTITAYSWDFGDGTTGKKVTVARTFGASGTHDVTLTVLDDKGAQSSVTQSVTTVNPPSAAFTHSCSYQKCTFDARGSSDPDGTVTGYDWTFGDGKTGSGATTSHTYAGAGAHTVTLRLTDDNGSHASASHKVTTTAPPAVWARDAFERTVRSGWGKADVGGTWTRSGCSATAVTGHSGHLVVARARACSMSLTAVHRAATDTTATVAAASVPSGGLDAVLIGRRISATTDIRLQLHMSPNGTVTAQLRSLAKNASAALSKSVTVKPAKRTAQLHVELQVSGTKPTVVRAKVWFAGSAKPARWTLSGTTSLAAVQHPGGIGLAGYLPTSKSGKPKTATLRFSGFESVAAS